MAEAVGDIDILRRIEDTTLNDQTLARDARILGNFKASESEIRTFLKDKCIFIIGGTGLLGKVLVEKILRSCPEIRGVFILIKNKKGRDITQQLDELFESSAFSVLKKVNPNFRRKVYPVAGDLEELDLGMDIEDRAKIQDQVSIIFNVGGTVRFTEKLKNAVRVNVRETAEAIKLATGCARLAAFVQFSSAFASNEFHIDEKFYTVPINPIDLINLAENTDEAGLEEMTRVFSNYPNTFAFTKAIAEEYIRLHGAELPVCIFRPSLLTGAYKEPLRGWDDKNEGPTEIFSSVNLGLIRTLYCDFEIGAELVPVDMAINGAIAAAYQTAKSGLLSEGPKIYNYVSSCQKPITWGEFSEMSMRYGITVPSIKAVWYYSLSLEKNWFKYFISAVFLHFLPALLADAFSTVTGKKAQMFATCKKLYELNNAMEYFLLKKYKFTNNNVRELYLSLKYADQQTFLFDIDSLDWERHAETCSMGQRVYVLKDSATSLAPARIKWQRLKMYHLSVKYGVFVLGALLMLFILYSLFM